MDKKNDSKVEDQPAKIDYSSKSVRKASFRAECKRLCLSPKEASKKASLFNGVNVSRFKLVRMPP